MKKSNSLIVIGLMLLAFGMLTGIVHAGTINLYFYSEDSLIDNHTLVAIPTVDIYDLTNDANYTSDVNGLFTGDVNTLDWNKQVQLRFSKLSSDFVERVFDYNFSATADYNIGILLLTELRGQDITFLVRDENSNLWTSKYLMFEQNRDFYIYNPSLSEGATNYNGTYSIYTEIDDWTSTIVNGHAPNTFAGYSAIYNAYLFTFIGGASGGAYEHFGIWQADVDFLDINSVSVQYYWPDSINGTFELQIRLGSDLTANRCNGSSGWGDSTLIGSLTYASATTNSWTTFTVDVNSDFTDMNDLCIGWTDNGGGGVRSPGSMLRNVSTSPKLTYNIYTESILTGTDGKASAFVYPLGDYNANLVDTNRDLKNVYQKTSVIVQNPRDEITGGVITPWRVSVGGLMQYADTNLFGNANAIMIFGGTDTSYNFTISDWNAIPAYELYVPRTYNVANPWGADYNPIYTFQPYLISKADAIEPTIQVMDKLKRPVANVKLEVFGLVNGVTTLIEDKFTDATGKVSFSAVPLNLYQVYMYKDNGTILVGTYEIQPRTNTDVFFLMIDLIDVVPGNTGYMNIDVNWDNTEDSYNINVEDVKVDANIFTQSKIAVANITGYTIKAYQNGVQVGTETFVSTGSSVHAVKTFSGAGFDTQYTTADLVITVTYTFAGYTYTKTFVKTIATTQLSHGLLYAAKQIPNDIGHFWSVIIALLITIGILWGLSASGYVESTSAIAILGIMILGVFVFIGWLDIGMKVAGVDIMVYTYILCAMFGGYMMMKEGLR